MPASTSDAQISEQTQDDESSLDVNLLKELGKKALIDALNSVREYHPALASQPTIDIDCLQVNGAKTLVLDSSLAGPLGLVTEVTLLKVWHPLPGDRVYDWLNTSVAPWSG
jgi:hypothetical protein